MRSAVRPARRRSVLPDSRFRPGRSALSAPHAAPASGTASGMPTGLICPDLDHGGAVLALGLVLLAHIKGYIVLGNLARAPALSGLDAFLAALGLR